MDDPGGFDLPFRWLRRVLFAGLAGRIDAALEDGDLAAGAFGAARRESGLLRTVDPQRIDEAVAEVVAEIENLAVDDLAVRFGQSDVALRVQPLGLLVVDDLVGFERRTRVIDLHIADRRDALVGVVVVHLGRAHEHLILRALRAGQQAAAGLSRLRTLREGDDAAPLGERGRRVGDASDGDNEDGGRHGGEAPPAATRQTWTSGGHDHHPSSWCSSIIRPVSPPASGGRPAAITGDSSPALLKSPITFDMT